VNGVEASDGSLVAADQMIDGGPSVLYDAVAVLPAEAGIDDLLQESAARDFVTDAFTHCKFIGHSEAAERLFAKVGIADDLDEGVVALGNADDVAGFMDKLAKLRLWSREPSVKMR
jgi:catalase